jgi:hypothetical protein
LNSGNETDLQEIGIEEDEWIKQAKDRYLWQALVNVVIK